MANPNIVNVSSIFGKTDVVNLNSTSAIQVVSNANASNKIFKINAIYISNVDGTNNADITINLYSAASLGGTATEICRLVTVPAKSTLIVVDKNSSLYMEENRSIGAIASVANRLKVLCSYEEIA